VLTIGVDAARGGWIAVALAVGRFMDAAFERRFCRQVRSSSETLSTWGVCGNKSTGLVRSSV
jgi:hypothetical protein